MFFSVQNRWVYGFAILTASAKSLLRRRTHSFPFHSKPDEGVAAENDEIIKPHAECPLPNGELCPVIDHRTQYHPATACGVDNGVRRLQAVTRSALSAQGQPSSKRRRPTRTRTRSSPYTVLHFRTFRSTHSIDISTSVASRPYCLRRPRPPHLRVPFPEFDASTCRRAPIPN